VHEVGATRALVKMLAESASEREVFEKFQRLSWDEWLDALGPRGWEALCLGYLILEADFVPTGLDVGGTLPLFDLIGKSRAGNRVYAQCKKNPSSSPHVSASVSQPSLFRPLLLKLTASSAERFE
jgi:hypothetical protein